MVFKTKIKCPICEGEAKLSKTSLQMFGGLVTLKDTPIYECRKCNEKFATGKIVDKTLEKTRKEFSFARKIVSTGGSLAITVPPDPAKFYKLKKGENVQLVPAGEHLMKVEV
ncbi:MAG: YgiT-type zinc finger protein [Candidatus Diapherotrites archaeon]|nr:YgiT-type zinc finger protein [Candidatus Diapherotrites archaeon]